MITKVEMNGKRPVCPRFLKLHSLMRSSLKVPVAIEFIRINPVTFVRLTGLRVLHFWLEPRSDYWLPISAVSMLGLMFLFRSGHELAFPIAIIVCIFPVPYYITHSESWYRHPLDPLALLLCSLALSCGYDAIHRYIMMHCCTWR